MNKLQVTDFARAMYEDSYLLPNETIDDLYHRGVIKTSELYEKGREKTSELYEKGKEKTTDFLDKRKKKSEAARKRKFK